MVKPDTRHVTRQQGTSYNDRDTGAKVIARVSYGLVSVRADKACNYSYREFWL